MTALILNIETRADAERAIVVMSQTGCEHRVPLIRALLDGRIAHFETQRTGCAGTTKKFLAMTADRPTLVLVGDDDDAPTGPDGWALAERLLRWAGLVVLHGAGPQRWHYEAAIELAGVLGRVLFVETSSQMLPAWKAAATRWAPRSCVQVHEVPPGGAQHPTDAGRVIQ